jgi:hypothetical protein
MVEALWLLKPIAWRDYERWLGLMTACKFEGIDRATFVHWSIQDERYGGDHCTAVGWREAGTWWSAMGGAE